MLIRSKAVFAFVVMLLLTCFTSCDRNKPTEPETGYISVHVYDTASERPIQDAEITVVPGDLVQLTDVNGRTVFEVDPGEYYVDAEICCFIIFPVEYHIPVTVTKRDTVKVEMADCFSCE